MHDDAGVRRGLPQFSASTTVHIDWDGHDGLAEGEVGRAVVRMRNRVLANVLEDLRDDLAWFAGDCGGGGGLPAAEMGLRRHDGVSDAARGGNIELTLGPTTD